MIGIIRFKSFILLISLTSFLISCKESKKEEIKPAEASGLTTNTVKNLPANPTDGNGTGHYTFFSFKQNGIVSLSDSASILWDIGFNGTTIIVNGGTSGPGDGAAMIHTGIFSELIEAPETGYRQDNQSALPPNAIPTGSDNGWYYYNSTTHVITPIPGRVLVFRTAQGKYAKVEIINYYKDMPSNPTSADIARYYTFRYSYQDDGSRKLQ